MIQDQNQTEVTIQTTTEINHTQIVETGST